MPSRKTSSRSAPLSPHAPSRPASRTPRAILTNLEMEGERLKIFSLQTLLTNKKNPDTRAAAKLGDVLLPWYEKTVAKPAASLDGIVELWELHVPAKIASRSRLLGFHRGTLTVAVVSATLRAELDRLLRGGLLRQLQGESRGAIYRIKTCVQGSSIGSVDS